MRPAAMATPYLEVRRHLDGAKLFGVKPKKPRVIDADYEIVNVPATQRHEPILQPRWWAKLLLMLAIIGFGTAMLLNANGHWPFDR
ncbi:MAG TPA: hypothetical protein VIO94_15995 [Phenylobacterium sp.]